MKAMHSRCAFSACSITALVVLLSGCTIGGKSFSIDSTSRIPFFGLELKERGPKSSAPVYRSIAQSTSDRSDVTIDLQVARIAAGRTVPSASNSPAISISTSNSHPAMAKSRRIESSFARKTNLLEDRKIKPKVSIPLPRTDVRQRELDRTSAVQQIDFQ